jgi:hypothetical protein
VSIPKSTQALLASQSAEAILAKALAAHLKKPGVANADQLTKATSLYNDAVSANNAVIAAANLQLAQSTTKLDAAVLDPLSETAKEKLKAFRTYAQEVGKFSNLNIEAIQVKSIGVTEGIEAAFIVAKEAYGWWLDENKRQRAELQAHMKTYLLPQWIDVK